jgi:hypothetical protein
MGSGSSSHNLTNFDKKYNVTKELGNGAFSVVKLCINRVKNII